MVGLFFFFHGYASSFYEFIDLIVAAVI